MDSKKVIFSDSDKEILINLVMKYKDVLESKKTDALSINKKKATWCKLSAEYNSIHGVRPRDVKQIRKCWENLKCKWKKERGQQVRDVFATGEQLLTFVACRPLTTIA